MKTHTLENVTDNLVGKIGSSNRDTLEHDLQIDLIGNLIKQIRKS